MGPSIKGLLAVEGRLVFYSQLNFHAFTSFRFHYNYLDVPVCQFFRKEGWSRYGRCLLIGSQHSNNAQIFNYRGGLFIASVAKERRWALRVGHLEVS